jgi:hypothetical protein
MVRTRRTASVSASVPVVFLNASCEFAAGAADLQEAYKRRRAQRLPRRSSGRTMMCACGLRLCRLAIRCYQRQPIAAGSTCNESCLSWVQAAPGAANEVRLVCSSAARRHRRSSCSFDLCRRARALHGAAAIGSSAQEGIISPTAAYMFNMDAAKSMFEKVRWVSMTCTRAGPMRLTALATRYIGSFESIPMHTAVSVHMDLASTCAGPCLRVRCRRLWQAGPHQGGSPFKCCSAAAPCSDNRH